MALEKMRALANYLREKNLCSEEQLDFYMQNGTATRASKYVGDGLLLCHFQYDAVITVERFSQDAYLFLALIVCWLMDNDRGRDDDELPDPVIDVNDLDDDTADVDVTITFIEDITAVEHDEGEIDFNGKKYRLAPAVVDIANAVSVGERDPLDAEYIRPEN